MDTTTTLTASRYNVIDCDNVLDKSSVLPQVQKNIKRVTMTHPQTYFKQDVLEKRVINL